MSAGMTLRSLASSCKRTDVEASHQAEAGFDDGDGGGDGGFGAEDTRAEVGEGEIICAEEIAFDGRPAALGADGEDDILRRGLNAAGREFVIY